MSIVGMSPVTFRGTRPHVAATPRASSVCGRLSAGRFVGYYSSVEVEMSVAENKELLAQYVTEVWDEANLDAIRNLLLPVNAPLGGSEVHQLAHVTLV
jgi:hypothetical protein